MQTVRLARYADVAKQEARTGDRQGVEQWKLIAKSFTSIGTCSIMSAFMWEWVVLPVLMNS